MDGWGEVSVTSIGSSSQELDRTKITSLQFDNVSNLLWCGDSKGYTRSFAPSEEGLGMYGEVQLSQYTKFRASWGNYSVLQHLNHQRGILTTSPYNVNLNTRRGVNILSLNKTNLNEPSFGNLTCMSLNYNQDNDLMVGGDSLFKIDLNKPISAVKYNMQAKISLMNNSSKYLTLAKSNGELEIFDADGNQIIKSFSAHNGFISDFDVQGNYIATCGCSIRYRRGNNAAGSVMVDPLVNIFDLRMMKPLAPIPFSNGASYVRFHPKLSNVIIVASPNGQIQFVDMYDQSNMSIYQADITLNNRSFNSMANKNFINGLQMSANGEFFAFNDINQNIHLWSLMNNANMNFVNFPEFLEQPTIQNLERENFIPVDGIHPLSSVGMPYYKDILLSFYNSDLHFPKELSKVPLKFDEVLQQSKDLTVFPYDPLKYGKHNRSQPYVSLKENVNLKHHLTPMFISERGTKQNSSVIDEHIFQHKLEEGDNSVPNCYTNLKIQYSKFGVEDFDFSYYNQTNYSGLENNLDNSYINSILQIYKNSPLFQNCLLSCLLQEWLPNSYKVIIEDGNTRGSSILNEVAYLLDMMNKSKGKNCRISNLSEVINENKLAKNLGLIDTNDCKNFDFFELKKIACDFNEFLIRICNLDMANECNASLEPLMRVDYSIEASSPSCGFINSSKEGHFTINLLSPPANKVSILLSYSKNTTNSAKDSLNITDYLDYTLNQVSSIPCQQCNSSYAHNLDVKVKAIRLPPILSINMKLNLAEFNLLTQLRNWLLPEIFVSYTETRIEIQDKPSNNSERYSLSGFVCEISQNSPFLKGEHSLVTYVKIENKWYLFNDFLVMPLEETEVFDLSKPWKKPIILLYEKQVATMQKFDISSFADLRLLDKSILYRDHFACETRKSVIRDYELLTNDEAPHPNSLVAIDAEFVILQPEELEIHSNGTKNLVKPKKISLARVSVIRGEGGKKGVPFIDDYISHTCHIEDYLTNFSGIEAGDLDPINSHKSLTTLQTSYRKLWLLLNLGCVFVGHGLQNDFRCINLQVPKEQIRDTADFFYLPEFKRKLSLKFLAYILLKERVQTGNHDSIEDAHTALLLYEKYLQLQKDGGFDNALHRIYQEGQQLRFRAPDY